MVSDWPRWGKEGLAQQRSKFPSAALNPKNWKASNETKFKILQLHYGSPKPLALFWRLKL